MANNINENNNQSITERLTEASVSEMEKQVKQKTAEKLQTGVNPNEILSQLLSSVSPKQVNPNDVLSQITELSQQNIPTGERVGILTSLMKGAGLSRPEKLEPLGMEKAIKIQGLANEMSASGIELPKKQVELLNSLIELSNKVKTFQNEGEQIERDISGQLTAKGIKQTKEAEIESTKKAEDEIKKEQLKNDLNVYFEIADLLPTGEGADRFKVGIKNFAQSITQETPIGVAASSLDSLNKRLRVTLVRAAGDVGNLNVVEQKAAERLLFSKFDSTQTRSLKKAILIDLTKAIKSKDTSKVKTLVGTWMNTDDFKNKLGSKKQESTTKEFKTEEEAIKSGVKGIVIINGKKARID